MTDDIVDFDDLDEFDYSDLGDINAADLDIENLERELGLVDDDATKESTTPAKTSEDASKTKPQTTTTDKKELKDKLTSSTSSSSTTATVTPTATTPAATPSLPQNRSGTTTASPSTKPSSSQEPSTRSQQLHKPMSASGMGSSSPRKTGGGGPRPNNAFQGAGGIMYSMPPTNMVHMGQFPFAQGMMGMNMMMMPPPPPPPTFPAPFAQMAFPGAQKIHINPKFAASRPDIFGANNNNGNPMAHQQQQHRRVQPAIQSISQSSPETGDNNALKRQRELIMEQQRKRRERREAEVKAEVRNGGVVSNGTHFQHQGRTNAPTSTVANNRVDQRHPEAPEKREITIKGLGTSKGISIKGAAAAASATPTMPPPPPLQQYQPPHRRRVADASSPPRFDSLSPARTAHSPAGNPNVLSRITQRGVKRSSPPPSDTKRYEPPAKKSAIPIQTAGKSSKITIANVSTNVSEDDIMGLAKSIPGRIENVKIDKSAKKAVVAFDSPESAVIFRRQYNRSHLDGEVIVVTFCT